MMSNHDALGTLRGLRKKLRRLHCGSHKRRWTQEQLAESRRLWEAFYKRLDECIAREMVNGAYRYWFSREHVISPRWGTK